MCSSATERTRAFTTLVAAMCCALLACESREAPPAEPRPAPAPPAAAAPTVDAQAAADGAGADARLGMMARHALWKAKKEADAKLAAELAAQEQARLIKFDRAKLPKHAALLAFTKKARAQLDAAAAKLKGKPNAPEQLEKVVQSQRKAIAAQAKALESIDPKGGNSNITTDHDMSLQLLANEYPAAIGASLKGDDKPLAEARAELDKRQAKIESWLAEVKKAKK
jgi:hypothetical protein